MLSHQYRILIKSEKAVFHLFLIHGYWFESIPSETSNITIVKGKTTVAKGTTAELIGILMQFNMKYHNNTGLGVEKPLDNLHISNPEYHKAKGRPTKRYKSSVEDNQNISSSVAKSNEGFLKTCSYCLGRGHNIRGCASKHKADKKMLISIY
ncbi:hypothetical protein RhiirA4_544153 [Rhizophagus irregularis]|uniref:Uncharacterized protein n=1 Tax=Rhizophagus irregularis TaxID=588596 RepID=A0A2I1GM51_9GLOM|nr:hypothetical protein RhiirA4_544153 [Rhizophagus irregularis]